MTCKTRTLIRICATPVLIGAMASTAFADTAPETAPQTAATVPATIAAGDEPWPVYEGPGIDNDIVARIGPDAVVEVSGCLEADPWCALSGPDFSGWVAEAAIDTGGVTPPAIDVDWENPLIILVDEETLPEVEAETE